MSGYYEIKYFCDNKHGQFSKAKFLNFHICLLERNKNFL